MAWQVTIGNYERCHGAVVRLLHTCSCQWSVHKEQKGEKMAKGARSPSPPHPAQMAQLRLLRCGSGSQRRAALASDVRGEVKAATIHRKSCRVVEESSCLTSTLVCCGCCLRGDAASVEVQLQSRTCTNTCMRAHRRTRRHATTVTTDGCALRARLEREEGSDDCV
jgi:hypothetical protein